MRSGKKFEEVVARTIKEEHLTPLVDIDLPLDFSEISDKLSGLSADGPIWSV